LLIRVLVPAIVGILLAAGASFGLVYSQTKAPSVNPAKAHQILTYGTPAT
jgi:hypothetical protein